jgi:hypothetical protein
MQYPAGSAPSSSRPGHPLGRPRSACLASDAKMPPGRDSSAIDQASLGRSRTRSLTQGSIQAGSSLAGTPGRDNRPASPMPSVHHLARSPSGQYICTYVVLHHHIPVLGCPWLRPVCLLVSLILRRRITLMTRRSMDSS